VFLAVVNNPYHATLLNNEQTLGTISGVCQVEGLQKFVGGQFQFIVSRTRD
jgi:hypothetical protein